MDVLRTRITTARTGLAGRIISIAGEIDLHTAPELADELDAALAEGVSCVTIDLTATSFIDSTVLGVLLDYRRRLQDVDGALVLVTQDRRILRTLEVTGLDRTFTIEPTLAEAVAAGTGGRSIL